MQDREAFKAAYRAALRRVMIQMMLADGVVEEAEIQTIQEIYRRVSGSTIGADEIRHEAESIKSEDVDVLQAVKAMLPNLNEVGKQQVLKAAWYVASSDGDVPDSERVVLDAIGTTMGWTEGRTKALLAGFEARRKAKAEARA